MKKIAIIHEWLTNVAGSERVLLALHEIYPDAPIYTSVYDSNKTKPFDGLSIYPSILQKVPFAKSRREVLIPLTPFAFEQFDLSEYDIVISNSHMAAKGVITKPETIHISYCHTPPRYLWEPDIDPRASGGKFSGLRKLIAHKMRIWDRVAADRVDHYIANSNNIANRIKKYYGRNSTVVYPPVDVERFAPTSSDKIKDYFLFVSRLIDYKKCDLVIEAFNQLGLPLKVVGQGPEKSKLKKMAKANIEFLGHISDEEMRTNYAEATAFVFAAEEDFGIVPIEAMAAGRPVIAYRAGGAKETVVEGITGCFFDDQTAESLVGAIKTFKSNDYDVAKIRQHAEKFSNERFKKEFAARINELVSNAVTT